MIYLSSVCVIFDYFHQCDIVFEYKSFAFLGRYILRYIEHRQVLKNRKQINNSQELGRWGNGDGQTP